MRSLAQPKVVTSAAIAAALSAVLSLPRMLLWENRPFTLWYIETTIFLCGFVLWAFVFGWHTEYTRRPLFTLKIQPYIFIIATFAGIIAGLGLHLLLDPALRARHPQDFPADFKNWIAATLFTLTFLQLFLMFAPFAWAMRLFRNEKIATWLTVAIIALVFALKANTYSPPLPALMLAQLLVLRIASGFLAVWFYLRGGIFLAWWIGLIIEARHLLTIYGY